MHLNVGATSHKIEEEEDFVLRTILANHCLNVALLMTSPPARVPSVSVESSEVIGLQYFSYLNRCKPLTLQSMQQYTMSFLPSFIRVQRFCVC